MAFDPASVVALSQQRDSLRSMAPVVAVVPELEPAEAWGQTDADRYVTIDDEAAVRLAAAKRRVMSQLLTRFENLGLVLFALEESAFPKLPLKARPPVLLAGEAESRFRPRDSKVLFRRAEGRVAFGAASGSASCGDQLPVWIIGTHFTRERPDIFLTLDLGRIAFDDFAFQVAHDRRHLTDKADGDVAFAGRAVKGRFLQRDFANTYEVSFNNKTLIRPLIDNRLQRLIDFWGKE